MVDELTPPAGLPTRTEAGQETVDLPEGTGFFTTGQVLGDRYEILEMLGRGGMGEVWRAFDLKLRVEVGLKALRDDLFQSERRLELLRQEVRAAREVVSPNVCRIFDLIEIDGRELVSMEYVDGATLLAVLQERGPLELKEAQDIASQFLAGLEAIHKAGLVHRDVKPENIMLTRAGRVVVMDFGLARGPESGAGSVSGTPAYMAPEHAAGGDVDARADVYSAGVVLAEMVSPEGIKSYESRQSLWQGVHSEPAQIPDSPWAPVINRAVARDRDRRQNSAHTLIRELEDVTLRVEGAEDLHPYPGLASFTEDDAEYFFGREAEVEQMWRRLDRPHLLAVVGPSGAGKTSFLQAGLIPSAGPGWGILRCSPGTAPFTALGQALAREMAGDVESVELLARGNEPDALIGVVERWRRRHNHALLIVDQFEELFTLCSAEEQHRFAELVGRLAVEADVFTLLSMRDDFLIRCREQEALTPIFTDLTVLLAPTGGALRRAVVQPATKCGYRFEDDELVEEMLGEVEGERGALPLLAFAAARLWEKRDRESGLLTRQAYRDIGGVGGALARHAEGTIDRIGVEHIPVVRELFRNLVTAEGTRAVREWDELLSVFEGEEVRKLRSEKVRRSALPSVASEELGVRGQRSPPFTATEGSGLTPHSSPARASAAEVLAELIDARLLTSYEVRVDEHEPIRRVEIIHESLLANWPRLVRWQTQDADSTRQRDELRQAARTWDEHERSRDFLWTGKAFREFSVWRDNYPGGLSELEEAFSRATITQARRRKLKRQLAVAAAFVVLLLVLGVVGVSRQQAVAQADRAEAARLVALGTMRFEADRSEALAHAITSLERADTQDGRKLALRALWAGPPAMVLPELPTPGSAPVLPDLISPQGLAISPDGRFLAAGYPNGVLRVFPRDGGEPVIIQAFKDKGAVADLVFSPAGRFLVGGAWKNKEGAEAWVWETGEWSLVRTLKSPEPPELVLGPWGGSVSYGLVEPDLNSVLGLTFLFGDEPGKSPGRWRLRRWPLDGGPSEHIGDAAATASVAAIPGFRRGLLVTGIDQTIHLHRLDSLGVENPMVVGRHDERFAFIRPALHPTADQLAACDEGGVLRVWPFDGDGQTPDREIEAPGCLFTAAFSPTGSRIVQASNSGAMLWDLVGPPTSRPLRLGIENTGVNDVAFTPDGRWLSVAADGHQPYRLTLWPLSNHYPRVLSVPGGVIEEPIRFHPDGSQVYTSVWLEGGSFGILSWSLTDGAGVGPTAIFDGRLKVVDRQGRFLIAENDRGLWKVPLDGADPVLVENSTIWGNMDLDPTGRYLSGLLEGAQDNSIVGVIDLETRELVKLDPPGEGSSDSRYFDDSGRLLVARGGVLSRWDPETRNTEVLFDEGVPFAIPIGDGSRVWVGWGGIGHRSILDLEDGSRKPLPQAHQQRPNAMVIDPTGSIVATGHSDGDIRVGLLFSEEVHLLLGHEGQVNVDAISPDGRWIASLDQDGSAYLWPMPDLSKTPFHLLPYDELMAKLKALTNLRAVPDHESPTGYTVKPDFTAYRGWAEAPEW